MDLLPNMSSIQIKKVTQNTRQEKQYILKSGIVCLLDLGSAGGESQPAMREPMFSLFLLKLCERMLKMDDGS